MTGDRRSRLQSFLLGGIVGGIAGLAAGRLGSRKPAKRPPGPPGLSAFERAPCYQELLEQAEREREGRPS